MATEWIAITGGASGIGLATAKALRARGSAVAIADRDPRALAAAGTALGTDGVSYTQLDVTDEAGVAAWIESVPAPFRGLVTAAGAGIDRPFLDTDTATLRRLFEVNVVGTFVAAQAAARRMVREGGGAIVTVASVAGLRGSKGRAAYGPSKAAVINLTQVMAVDLAQYGVRVNCVCPGPVDTPLVAAMHDAPTRAQWIAHMPQRRYAAPGEIAGAIVFLLDPTQSSFVTGHVLAVDGGFAAAGLTAPDQPLSSP